MIELRNVSVVYPVDRVHAADQLAALRDCSLAFARGRFTVLLGPSGAGKSTLLRCLNLLTRPTSGEVVCDDLGPLRDRHTVRTHRRRTGMVFQQHHLIPRHSALQNVLLGRLGYHSLWRGLWPASRRERLAALECLDRVGLLNKALERAQNLSGGEQQRVGIARALVQEPQLLLADEPVASLDPATACRVLELLHRVCREDRLTAVVSLHQLELARAFADRVVGLNRGRVVFDGPPERLTTEVVGTLYAAPDVSASPPRTGLPTDGTGPGAALP
jgi:phosphonate transport system ATP-binding protein